MTLTRTTLLAAALLVLSAPEGSASLNLARAALDAQKPVSVCGEMASDPFVIPLLVGLGISSLSMVPSRILEAKKVIRSMNYQAARKMAKLALQASRIQEVKAIVSGGGWDG